MAEMKWRQGGESVLISYMRQMQWAARVLVYDDEATEFNTVLASKVGPNFSQALCDEILCTLVEMKVDEQDPDIDISNLAKMITQVTINKGFLIGKEEISWTWFESTSNDILNRFIAGNYSYTSEETQMSIDAAKKRLPGGEEGASFLNKLIDKIVAGEKPELDVKLPNGTTLHMKAFTEEEARKFFGDELVDEAKKEEELRSRKEEEDED